MHRYLMALSLIVLSACGSRVQALARMDESAPESAPESASTRLRLASYNVSLYDAKAGGLIERLEQGDATARAVASVLQHLRPDVVLLNEFDYDPAGRAAELFQRRYLEVPHPGLTPIRYAYRYSAPVNTGVPSGLDLDGDGRSDGPGDAWGYGTHPGQYGMLVLSRYPIDEADVRSFQHLRWSALPNARRPMNPDGTPFHPDAVWQALRLSSKSHWDVPLQTPLGRVHFLVSHPTPPVFDGPEDRNGARNADEIALWSHYLGAAQAPWLCDDQGRCGGLPSVRRFVLAGDLNADPHDGDGRREAIIALLGEARVQSDFVPCSEGARQVAASYGLARQGDAACHTGDFGPRVGTLRLDYLLPSKGFRIRDGGVFWPRAGSTGADFAGASDHHMVWLDLENP